MNVIYSPCPVVRTATMKLMRFVETDGVGGQDLVSFEKEILWLRESEGRIEFRHDGELLRHGSTYCDFYGFQTSIPEAIKQAKHACKVYSVTGKSSLEIMVRGIVRDIPVLAAPDQKTGVSDKTPYRTVPTDWLLHDEKKRAAWLAAETLEGRMDVALTRLEPVILHDDVVWSSQNDARTNADVLRRLKKRFAPTDAAR